jgi:SAM-dependent methyltransferase
LTRNKSFRPIPAAYWDDLSKTWGRQVYEKAGAHQFQYFEADLLISSVLTRRMRVLEIGCGTGGSTLVHAKEVRLLVATDVSRGMVGRARVRMARRPVRKRVRFALVDCERLPFMDGSFDAVIGRGVALSYIRDPGKALREIRRVLVPGGHIAIDAMNELSASSGRVLRNVRTIGGSPAYVEQSNEGDLQVRRVFYLKPKAPLARYASGSKFFKTRPRSLAFQTMRTERMDARYFPEPRLRRLAADAGFSNVQVVPLGQMYRLLMGENKELRKFAIRNRRALSRLAVELRSHFKVSSGFHVMLLGSRASV